MSTESKPHSHGSTRGLIGLISAMASLQIGAGGLITSSLFIAVLIINTFSCIEFFLTYKSSPAASKSTYLSLIFTTLSLSLFFLPPLDFLTGNTKADLFQTSQDILELGSNLGLYHFVNKNFSLSLNFWHSLQFFLIFLLIPGTLYLTARLSRAQKLKLAYILLAFATLNILAHLYNTHIINTRGKIWGFIDLGINKNSGIFINPNHYGAYIALFLPLIITATIRSLNKRQWNMLILHASLGALFIYGLLLSQSRGTYMLAALGFCLTIMLSIKRDKKLFTPAKTTIFLSIILLFTTLTPFSLNNELSHTGVDWGIRKKVYAAAPQMIADYPLGIGPGAYRFNSPGYISNGSHSTTTFHHSENTYLQLLIECGPLFFLSLIVLHLLWLKQVINNLQKHLISRRMCLWALTALAMIFVHSAYDYAVHIPVYTFSIAILYGLLLSRKSHTGNSSKPVLAPILLPITALLSSGFIYIKFHESIPQKAQFSFTNQANIEELSQNLTRTPQSWHNWLFLASSTSKLNSPHHYEFIERCLNQAAIHNPSNSELWRKLALYRLEMGQRSPSASAYRHYFLLQPKKNRLKAELQTRFILRLNKAEFENLLHQELSQSELTRDFIQSI